MSNLNIRKILSITFILSMFFFITSSMAQLTTTIDVAPNVLNLQNNAQIVTIHTDLAYSVVLASSVYLNDIEISSWKSDDRGNFVAKFSMLAVKNLPLVIDDYNTLTLTGTTTLGETFTGSQQILVISVISKR